MRPILLLGPVLLVAGCGDDGPAPAVDLAVAEAAVLFDGGAADLSAPGDDLPGCAPATVEACGRCGRRTCDAAGRWGPCMAEGACSPGEVADCGPDGTMTCATTCQWGECQGAAACVDGETSSCGACGGTTCAAGKWSLCSGAGPCDRGDQRDCGPCSAQECGEDCQWGDCESLCADDEVCDGTSCVPRPASLDGGVADLSPPPDLGRPPDAGAGCLPPATDAPLIFYYGVFHNRDAGKTYADKLNHGLIVPGLDVTFTVSGSSDLSRGAGDASKGKPESGEFKQFHDRCAHLAYNMSIYRLALCLLEQDGKDSQGKLVRDPCQKIGDGVEAAARFVEDRLADGWDYISVDELKRTHGVAFDNGSTLAKRFAALLKRLDKAGHGRRVILWVAPGTTDVTRSPTAGGTDNLKQYSDVLDACQTSCRRVIFETYPSLRTSTVMAGADRHLDSLGTRLHGLAPGTNRVAMAGVGVGHVSGLDMQDVADCDLAPYKGACGGKDGGLQRIFDRLHGDGYPKYWWGVGFYVLGNVEGHGPWDRQDFVDFLASRTKWWVGKKQP